MNTSYQLSDLVQLVKDNKLEDIEQTLNRDQSWSIRAWPRQNHEEEALVHDGMKQAIASGNIAAAMIFLNAGVDAGQSAYRTSKENGVQDSFLTLATTSGNFQMVKLLVDRGARVKQRSDVNSDGIFAFAAAMKNGNPDVVDYLLTKGADPDYGMSVKQLNEKIHYLAFAAMTGNLPLCEVILRHSKNNVVSSAIESARKACGKTIKTSSSYLARYTDSDREELVKWSKYDTSNLERFDRNKKELTDALAFANTQLEVMIKNLLDLAAGQDFSDLKFLKHIPNVAGFSFLGVSLNGKPITREMLKANGVAGADEALISLSDIGKINDPVRRDALFIRVVSLMKSQMGVAGYELTSNDAVNLVPLAVAAKIGDIETVRCRLKNAAVSPNAEFGGRVPVVEATKAGKHDVVELLMRHKDINQESLTDAIKAAKDAGHQAIVDELMAARPVDLPDKKGHTLLYQAVVNGSYDEVVKLLNRGANPNARSKDGYPLVAAAKYIYFISRDHQNKKPSNEHLKILQLLLAKGADPNLCDEHGYNALQAAGEFGCLPAFNMLFPMTTLRDILRPVYEEEKNKKAYPWYTDIMHDSYENAKGEFRRQEWLQFIKVLAANGADLNQPEAGYNGRGLLTAVLRGFPSTGRVWDCVRGYASSMRGHPDFDRMVDQHRKEVTFASQSAFLPQLEVLDVVLGLGADPSRKYAEDETTALHDFIYHSGLSHIPGGYARVIDRCIQKGFDINAVDKHGRTLLHIAARDGDSSLVKYLLANGANVNLCDDEGNTPLLLAMQSGGSSLPHHVVRYLIEYGADVSLKNKAGQTALSKAQFNHDEWVKSESYQLWGGDTIHEWEGKFSDVIYNLENADVVLERFVREHAPVVDEKKFIQDLYETTKAHSLQNFVDELDLPEEACNVAALFCDDVTHKIMTHPVVLRERVYDLDTLLVTVKDGKGVDPLTGREFTLAEIEPAKDVVKQISNLCHYLSAKYKQEKANRQPWYSKVNNFFGDRGSVNNPDDAREMKRNKVG